MNLALWDGRDHRGNRWIVARYSAAMPHLVRWQKWGARGKLLDQVAHWSGDRWGGGRWRPGKPLVPDPIRLEVERALQEAV